jgi:hypothetical protein
MSGSIQLGRPLAGREGEKVACQRDFFSPLPCCWAGIAFTRVCITLVYVDIVYFDQQEGGG